MSFGFGDDEVQLPKMVKKKPAKAANVQLAVQEGEKLGFVDRGGSKKRKTGPKQTEPQGKITVTGPKRVLGRLQSFCDERGGVAYWQAIEELLESVEGKA